MKKLSRRQFLTIAGLAVVIAGIPIGLRSCRQESLVLPWDFWKKLRAALKTSPDHLEAQSKKVVETGDPTQIFRFVCDQFLTIPVLRTGDDRSMPYGVRHVLRTGIGTHREKSELLANLLQAAGFETEIRTGKLDFESLPVLPEGLSQQIGAKEWIFPAFDPDFQWQKFERYLNDLDIDPEPIVKIVESTTIQDQFVQLFEAAIPERLRPYDYEWENLNSPTSVIAISLEGEEILYNPNVMGAEPGLSYTRNAPRKPYNPDVQVPNVKITVSASYNDSRYIPYELVHVEWPIDALIGRQVRINFGFIGDVYSILNARPKDLNTYVPCISLMAPELSKETREKFHQVGDAITDYGQVIQRKEAEDLVNGVKTPSLVQGNVSDAINISLSPSSISGFPLVGVEAEIIDSNGEPVMGLDEENFELLVNGEPRTFRFLVNQYVPPRVMFLFDASGSMPYRYQDLKRTSELLSRVVTACKAINPDTEFKIAGIGTEENLIHKPSGWLMNESTMQNYLRACRSGESNNWSALLGGTSSEASITVLITDADGTQKVNDYQNVRFQESKPAIIFGVKSSSTKAEQFPVMANKVNGTWHWIDEQEDAAIADLQRYIGETKQGSYVLLFEEENEDIPRLDLSLGLPSQGIAGELSIEVPPNEARKPIGKDAITGLYLSVEINRQIIRKTLGGLAYGLNSKHPITKEMLADVKRAFFANHTLSFEGASPTHSALLDDYLASALSMKSLTDALELSEPQQLIDQFPKLDFHHAPARSFAMRTRSTKQAWSKFAGGYQILLSSDQADQNLQYYESAQWLPMTQFITEQTGEPIDRIPNGIAFGAESIALQRANFSQDWLQAKAPLYPIQPSVNGGFFAPSGESYEFTRFLEARMRRLFDAAGNNFMLSEHDPEQILVWLMDQNTGVTLPNSWLLTPGGLSLNGQFDPEKRLIEIPRQWFKLLGLGLEAWDQLDRQKLAYLQVATVAVKELGEGPNPAEFAEQLKQLIRALLQAELGHGGIYFPFG
ncbi:MAG: hypothetical protein AAFV80_10780, partial [Bacteroidota bacterium]